MTRESVRGLWARWKTNQGWWIVYQFLADLLLLLLIGDVLTSVLNGRELEGARWATFLWDNVGFWLVAAVRLSQIVPIFVAGALLRFSRASMVWGSAMLLVLVEYTWFTVVLWNSFCFLAKLEVI